MPDPLPSPPPNRIGWPWQAEQVPNEALVSPPTVTVVTPSYNQAAFLEETIRSVLLQDYPALEYMVIDGGSEDGSVEIIRRYAPWLSYWVSEPDEGQSHALHKGFSRASGTVLAWLNSDDRYRPGALHAFARTFQAHPEAAVTFGRSAFCNADGDLTGIEVGEEFDLDKMLSGINCVSQPSSFFRRDAYEACGGIDRDLHYVMDMDLWLRLSLDGDLVFAEETWSDFRYHDESKSTVDRQLFLEETGKIVARLCDGGSLPPHAKPRAPRILGDLFDQIAVARHAAGDDAGAREALGRALRRDPLGILKGRHLGTLARVLLGRRATVGIKRRLGA